MRDYGIVSPQFWVGKTGKELRGDVEAQLVALYLMTSPHANMIGVYYCPVEYIAKETGLTLQGASEALRRLSSKDFCTYESETEWIFVHSFAANQIGESLKAADKRVLGVGNELAKVPKGQCWQAFRARYAVPYHLPIPGGTEAPPKPLRSQKQDQKQEQDIPAGFARFWLVWPKSDRKDAKGECLKAWNKAGAEPIADKVIADVERRKQSAAWTKDNGQFIPAPLVYLNKKRWEGADDAPADNRPDFV